MDKPTSFGRSPAAPHDEQQRADLGRLVQLADAIAALGGDSDYLIDALTEKLRSLRPVSTDSSLSAAERRFLVESGTMTEPQLECILTDIGRGSLQLEEVQSWMFYILDTLSAEQAAIRLNLTEEELELAVQAKEVLAVTVSGRLRFPKWQFLTRLDGRRLPGLSTLIPEIPSYGILSWAAFMHSPMEELSGFGPQTPIQWLRDGGDVESVLELLRDEEVW